MKDNGTPVQYAVVPNSREHSYAVVRYVYGREQRVAAKYDLPGPAKNTAKHLNAYADHEVS